MKDSTSLEIAQAVVSKGNPDPEVAAYFKRLREMMAEKSAAVEPAVLALSRLVAVCRCMSGQSFIVRRLLFSLWNGKRVDLSDLLRLDWPLRKDLLAVCLAFGHDKFFYAAFERAFTEVGLWDWFTSEGSEA